MNRIHRSMLLALCLLVVSLAATPPAHSSGIIGFTVSAIGMGNTRSAAIDAAVAELYAKNIVFGDYRIVTAMCDFSDDNPLPPCLAKVEANGLPKLRPFGA